MRVVDCPESGLSNRIGSVDLRLLSGDTAVHSDMIMWNREEKPEDAAILLQNAIFATPQISVRLEGLDMEQQKMLVFWMQFCREHIKALQNAPIIPQETGHLYPIVRTVTEEEEIIAVYSPDRVIRLDGTVKKHTVIWANKAEQAFLRTVAGQMAVLRRRNCMGEVLEKEERLLSGCQSVPMTPGGMLEIS